MATAVMAARETGFRTKKAMIGRVLIGTGFLFASAALILLKLGHPAVLPMAIGAAGLADLVAGGVMVLRG